MEKARRAIAADAPHIERLLALPGALLAPLSARAASQRPVAQRLERELLSLVLVDGDGEVVGFAVIKGSELSPITLPELTGANAQGYQGHDQFQVVESCLARRFPIYKSGDSNAQATVGQRQICYKLKAGEAGFILQPTSVVKF